MKVVIIGAGNIGLAMASYIAVQKNNSVVLFTEKNFDNLVMNDVEENIRSQTTNFYVSNKAEVLKDADYIFCTYPAFLRKQMIEKYSGFIKSGTKLGFVPGYGGAEFFCKKLIENGVIIFGLQRVPYVARAEGNVANILSKKKNLFVSTIPLGAADDVVKDIQRLLNIKTVALKEYLSITLSPSNPLIHVSGLYGAFKKYDENVGYDGKVKFYEQWDDETSKLLFAYDNELQNICRSLFPLDMRDVVPLPIYYESDTPEKLTKKLKSIESFKVVKVPLIGNKPDLNSRMFIEDYPFGVCVIKDIAQMVQVNTPVIDMLLEFYAKISGHTYFNKDGSYTDEICETGVPGIYGIKTKNQLIEFYHGGKL